MAEGASLALENGKGEGPGSGLLVERLRDASERSGSRAVGLRHHDRAPAVRQLGEPGLERDLAEQGRADLRGEPAPAAGGEEVDAPTRLRIGETAHVLHHTDHWNAH